MLGNLFAQPLSVSFLVYVLVWSPPPHMVTGQLADTPTRGLVNSRSRQLADWTSHGLHNSRMLPTGVFVVFIA